MMLATTLRSNLSVVLSFDIALLKQGPFNLE